MEIHDEIYQYRKIVNMMLGDVKSLSRYTAIQTGKLILDCERSIKKDGLNAFLGRTYLCAKDILLPAQPVDNEDPADQFLQEKQHALNLIKISDIDLKNIIHHISTKEIYQSIPKVNPIELGYNDAVEYQTKLGDDVIAAGIGITSFSILTSSLMGIISCIADSTEEVEVATDMCYSSAGEWFSTPAAQLLSYSLIGALLTGLYVHRQGWLGKCLHDPFKQSRSEKILKVYAGIANELYMQTAEARIKNDSAKIAELKALANNIRENMPLIKNELINVVQIESSEATRAMEVLEWACDMTTDGISIDTNYATHGPLTKVPLDKTEMIKKMLWMMLLNYQTIGFTVFFLGRKLWI